MLNSHFRFCICAYCKHDVWCKSSNQNRDRNEIICALVYCFGEEKGQLQKLAHTHIKHRYQRLTIHRLALVQWPNEYQFAHFHWIIWLNWCSHHFISGYVYFSETKWFVRTMKEEEKSNKFYLFASGSDLRLSQKPNPAI